MMVSDEEKRWIVVGIVMNKVAAPVLRDAVKQGMDTNYANLERHCQLLHPPCTLKTLTHGVVRADPILRKLKFENINNNDHLYGKHSRSYNFSINDSVDLAKLYLPDYLAQFSAFDDSLDMTAILRLLGFRNYMQLPAAVFSPHIQASADDVRENVRNKWGHVDVTEWTDALFNDCFDKLKTLVRSLGLTADVGKNTLDQLDDWQTKGCQLIMGHAVDKGLLCLVQDEVKDLIKDYSTIGSQLNLHNKNIAQLQGNVATLIDQFERREARLVEHHKRLEALEEKLHVQPQEAAENRSEEIKKVVERLVSLEAQISIRLQVVEEKVEQLEQTLTKADDRVGQLEQSQTNTICQVEVLKDSHTKTADEVELLKQSQTETAAKADQLDQRCAEVERIGLQLKTQDKPETSCMKSFDLNSCRSKLEDHYQKTATVPTSVWSKKSVVDIHQIYTRLSWVKEEQTPTGTTQSELKHYTEIFTANKNGIIPKRILVQGQTGIGKSTFVKKLLVDWVGVNKGTGDEQAAVLKHFELVVAVNLKEVSKCQSLTDVITLSNVFAKEDKYMTEGLVDYITNNQEKVLLIFDGYDEYRCGRDSEIYEIFSGNNLRSCCVLITTRISKADELRGGEDLHAEIIGFSEVDRECFMSRFLNSEEVLKLEDHLYKRKLGELAKVPLLLLFFCILWRKGQSKSFPKSKTTLYMDIIQFILNHNHSKQTGDKTKTRQYVELKSFKEILSEIGKVALQGLLKDDHLFEYSQLSDSVRCGESVFIGLLQITEYSETSQPVGMVSFIHKSIQEFLAAWYITYRCIPKGGNLGEIGVKLEECMALENVFEFVCGLSEDGALEVFRHLKSVRISDPSLDLAKTVQDVESETHAPLSGVTYRHWQFIDLVVDLFESVDSNADLSRPCLDCLGSVLLLCSERSLPEDLLLRTKEANPLCLVSLKTRGNFVDPPNSVLTLNRVAKMLVTEIAEIFKVSEFVQKFKNICDYCRCSFSSVLNFFNGQVYFNITHLKLLCEDHAALFADSIVPSHSLHLSSGQLSLKFLKVLDCSGISFLMKSLGAAVKHCHHLESTKVSGGNDSLIHFLQHVPNYRRCSLSIWFCCLSSKGAVELSYLLPRFENIIQLDLRLAECSDKAVTKLVAAIKHKTLENLTLSATNMPSAAAEALSQSLPEFSTLRTLKISSLAKCSDVAVTKLVAAIKNKTLENLTLSETNMTSAAAEALSQSLPEFSTLRTLEISGLTECSDVAVTKLVAAIKHKTLKELQLSKMNLPLAAAEVLGKSLPKLSVLQTLEISGLTDCCNEVVTKLVATIKPKTIKKLQLSEINLTSAVAMVFRQSQPEGLRSSRIGSVDGCSLQWQIFADCTLPLSSLKISGWTECSAETVTRLIDVVKHKPLEQLKLSKIQLSSAAAEALSESLPKLSALQALKICDLAKCSSRAVTSLVSAIKHKTLKELKLCGIKLTLEAGEALGQSLGELSALQTLKISVSTECSAEAVTGLGAAFKHKPLRELKLSGIKLTEAISQLLLEVSDLRLELIISGFAECSAEEASRLLEVAIPSRIFKSAVIPHAGCSKFIVKTGCYD